MSASRGFLWRSLGQVAVLSLSMALPSGCVTREVWRWAGEGRHTFIPSDVTSLGLLRQEGAPDRLFFRVEPDASRRDAAEVFVVAVPLDWRERPRVTLADGVELESPLEAKPAAAALPNASEPPLAAVPLMQRGTFPAFEDSPYAYVAGSPGTLYVYAADVEARRWVRLGSAITGRLVTTPAPSFNYVLAIGAAPVTVSLDAVGVVFYAVLWPLWASAGIDYGSEEEGFGPEEGKRRREYQRTNRETSG